MPEIIECPHCFTRVYPKSDDTCPACMENVTDTAGANLDLTAARFSVHEPLPELCIVCGESTARTYKYSVEIPGRNESSFLGILSVLFLGRLFGRRVKKAAETLSLGLPLCKNCEPHKKGIEAHYIDKDTETMTFVVHKAFKEKLEMSRDRK